MAENNQLTYGKWTFSGNEVKDGTLHQAASLLSVQLEADTLAVTVRCADPTILQTKTNEKMTYAHQGRQKGVFYAQAVERVGPELYKISGVSNMGRLSAMPHPGGVYTGQTAEAVTREIMGNIPFVMKDNLRTVKLYGWLPYAKPPEKSARDNLVQVLFALGAAVKTDLDGTLRIVPLWDGVAGVIEKSRMYQGGSVEYEKTPATSVEVTEHQYMTGGEDTKLFEGDALNGDIITFSDPMHSLSATGFRILESGANYAKLSTGNGVLTGKKYIHTTRQVTETIGTGEANVKSVSDGTLVSLVNSRATAQRLAAYYKCVERIRNPVVTGTERPGDVVSIFHPYDRTYVTACIESADTTMSSVLKSNVTALVGYVPPSQVEVEYFERREVISPFSTFVVPDGVHSIRAVLIGTGKNGEDGKDGGNGTAGKTASISSSSGSNSGSGGTPGKGGEAGAGGSGGNINIVDMEVEPGQKLEILIEISGGGSSSEGPKPITYGDVSISIRNPGDETVIKRYSSADGAPSPTGYVDPITGDVYAMPGVSGTPGGDGGKSGTATSSGGSGEDVGDYKGGLGRYAKDSVGHATSNGTKAYKYILPSGGGGAALGEDGSRPTQGGDYGGGDGGNAEPPAAQTMPGGGGNGGHGGGGSGAGGGGYIEIWQTGDGIVSTSQSGASGGTGGKGSSGSSGAKGCVILYFGEPKKSKAGSPVDKNNRFILDKFGRLLVV